MNKGIKSIKLHPSIEILIIIIMHFIYVALFQNKIYSIVVNVLIHIVSQIYCIAITVSLAFIGGQ